MGAGDGHTHGEISNQRQVFVRPSARTPFNLSTLVSNCTFISRSLHRRPSLFCPHFHKVVFRATCCPPSALPSISCFCDVHHFVGAEGRRDTPTSNAIKSKSLFLSPGNDLFMLTRNNIILLLSLSLSLSLSHTLSVCVCPSVSGGQRRFPFE